MRIEGDISAFQKIKRGVRQGCVLSPELFSLYSEIIMRNITINGIKLKQRDHFKYLGALVSSDGRNNTEISARIAQAKMMFQKMKTVLTNSHISIQKKKKRTLECYIEPILMYGCEAWTISKQAQKKTKGSRNVVPEKNDENIMDG